MAQYFFYNHLKQKIYCLLLQIRLMVSLLRGFQYISTIKIVLQYTDILFNNYIIYCIKHINTLIKYY